MRAAEETTVTGFVKFDLMGRARRARCFVRKASKLVAPTGWRELRISFDSFEQLMRPKAIMHGYIVAVVLAPVGLVISGTAYFADQSSPDHVIFATYAGFNALAVTACLTVAVLVTILAMLALGYLKLVLIRLDVNAAFRAIASWIGYGSAAGVVAVGLLPFAMRLSPSSYAVAQGGQSILTPRLLVDVPAGFAVLGFGIGVLVAVVTMGRAAENLVIRRFLVPAVMLGVLALMARADIAPGGILRGIVTSMPTIGALECENADIVLPHLQDPSWLIRAVDQCGDGIYLENEPFLWGMGILLGGLAIGYFIADFHRASSGRLEGDASVASSGTAVPRVEDDHPQAATDHVPRDQSSDAKS
jgi:hypothetical protein